MTKKGDTVVLKRKDDEEFSYKPKIKVVGVGGGGGNIVGQIAKLVGRLDFVAANTDLQALRQVGKNNIKTLPFGETVTKGLGCGMDAFVGETAALQDKEKIVKLFANQDLVILVASLGGGTGSGAAPVFVQTAKEQKCLSIGVFTLPFSFEGEQRKQVALSALEKIKPFVNTYVVIPNDNIFHLIEKTAPFHYALSMLNKKLAESLEGFVETLAFPGFINIDFADIQSLLEGKAKLSYLASSVFSGQDRARLALEHVLINPLLLYQSNGAERILLNIAGGKDLTMQEVAFLSRGIWEKSPKTKVIFGITLGSAFAKKVRVTLFALGVHGEEDQKHPKQKLSVKKRKKQIHVPRQARLALLKTPMTAVQPLQLEQAPKVQVQPRRNALELQKAIEQEMEALQEKEKVWDIPAFLRAKKP